MSDYWQQAARRASERATFFRTVQKNELLAAMADDSRKVCEARIANDFSRKSTPVKDLRAK